ncbi:MAG TPA: GYD domain-containing protein [Patescibacteria group bacterium]|nr:GYD domain-containing protein [Patescibacteria group bacterium]
MPKYLFQGSYRPEGTKGLMKEGASQRRANLETLVKQQGGRLEAFYFTFGDADAIGIAELPDNVTAAALSLAINASGLVGVRTTVLLTTDEMDQATKKQIGYRPPGH